MYYVTWNQPTQLTVSAPKSKHAAGSRAGFIINHIIINIMVEEDREAKLATYFIIGYGKIGSCINRPTWFWDVYTLNEK